MAFYSSLHILQLLEVLVNNSNLYTDSYELLW